MATVRDLLTRIFFRVDPAGITALTGSATMARAQLDGIAASSTAAAATLQESAAGIAGWIKGIMGLAAAKSVLFDFVGESKRALQISDSLGISPEVIQTWWAAGSKVDVAAEQITMSLGKIGRKAVDASTGGAEAAAMFRQLGVDVKGADGKVADTETLLNRVADAFHAMPAGAKRTGLALKLFEESGAKLIPVLSKGSKGMAAMRAELEKAGVVMSRGTLQQTKKFSDAMGVLKLQAIGFRNAIALMVLPALTGLIGGFVRWAREGNRMATIMHALKVATMAAGGALAYMAGAAVIGKIGALVTALRAVYASMWAVGGLASKVFAPAVLLAAVIAFIAGAVEDLYVFATGGKSAIGEMLNPKDASALKNILWALGDIFKSLWKDIKELGGVIGEAFRSLAKALGFKDLTSLLKWVFKYAALIVAAFIWGAVMLVKGLIQAFIVMGEFVVNVFKFIGDVAATVWQAIKDTFWAFVQLFIDLGRTIASEWGRLKAWFGEKIATPALDAIKAAFYAIRDAANAAYEAGRRIVGIVFSDFGAKAGVLTPGGGASTGGAGAAAPLAPSGGAGGSKSITITGGPVTVNGANADPGEIGRMVRKEQESQFQKLLQESMGDFVEEAP